MNIFEFYIFILIGFVTIPFGYFALSPFYFLIKAVFGEEDAGIIYFVLATLIMMIIGIWYILYSAEYKEKKRLEMQDKIFEESRKYFENRIIPKFSDRIKCRPDHLSPHFQEALLERSDIIPIARNKYKQELKTLLYIVAGVVLGLSAAIL